MVESALSLDAKRGELSHGNCIGTNSISSFRIANHRQNTGIRRISQDIVRTLD
jgi:hypothetical protein